MPTYMEHSPVQQYQYIRLQCSDTNIQEHSTSITILTCREPSPVNQYQHIGTTRQYSNDIIYDHSPVKQCQYIRPQSSKTNIQEHSAVKQSQHVGITYQNNNTNLSTLTSKAIPTYREHSPVQQCHNIQGQLAQCSNGYIKEPLAGIPMPTYRTTHQYSNANIQDHSPEQQCQHIGTSCQYSNINIYEHSTIITLPTYRTTHQYRNPIIQDHSPAQQCQHI